MMSVRHQIMRLHASADQLTADLPLVKAIREAIELAEELQSEITRLESEKRMLAADLRAARDAIDQYKKS